MNCKETLYMNAWLEIDCDLEDDGHEEHVSTDTWFPLGNDPVKITIKWKKL